MIRPLHRLLARARRDDGNATIEFVLIVPAFLVLFMSAVEAGVILARAMVLDRAVDIAVRDVRLGIGGEMDHDELKARICENASMIPDCEANVRLELRPISTETWAPLDDPAECVDREADIQPPLTFTHGMSNELMMVRACAVVDLIFPTTGLGLGLQREQPGPGFRIVASSAFVNEPR